MLEIFRMTTPITFLKETRDELTKVTWPNRSEVTRLTFAVIVVSLLVAFYIGALDFGFTKGLQAVIAQANTAQTKATTKTIQVQQPKASVPVKTVKPTPTTNKK